MQLRFPLRSAPAGAFLPSATGTWQALDRPPPRIGPRTCTTCRPRWAMDKYYGLIALLFVVLGIARGFVWVYLPPRGERSSHGPRRNRPNPLPPEREAGRPKRATPLR